MVGAAHPVVREFCRCVSVWRGEEFGVGAAVEQGGAGEAVPSWAGKQPFSGAVVEGRFPSPAPWAGSSPFLGAASEKGAVLAQAKGAVLAAKGKLQLAGKGAVPLSSSHPPAAAAGSFSTPPGGPGASVATPAGGPVLANSCKNNSPPAKNSINIDQLVQGLFKMATSGEQMLFDVSRLPPEADVTTRKIFDEVARDLPRWHLEFAR